MERDRTLEEDVTSELATEVSYLFILFLLWFCRWAMRNFYLDACLFSQKTFLKEWKPRLGGLD